MLRIDFRAEKSFAPAEHLLDRVSLAPLTAPLAAGSSAQAAVFFVAAGGSIRRHPATVPQILAVIDGAGEVSGDDGVFHAVSPGDAVYWAAGESHETRSSTGLTALVLEAAGLLPTTR